MNKQVSLALRFGVGNMDEDWVEKFVARGKSWDLILKEKYS
jgi:hypothetical protein